MIEIFAANGSLIGEEITEENNIEEIIISLNEHSEKKVLDVISHCNKLSVHLKIVPDMYDILMGYGRTEQLYGVPLMEIMPEMMPAWEQKIKRLIDISVALFILIVFFPVWILIALIIKIESPGPVFFGQKRVGKNGKIFTIYKFRSMVHKAEKGTGPV